MDQKPNHKELEQRVKELEKRERELEVKISNLEEANSALSVLLKRKDREKTDLEGKVLLNVMELVEPYLEKLKTTELDDRQNTYLGILKSNLDDLTSPFSHRLSSKYLKLTPTEIQVANLINQGKTTNQIANLFNKSIKTIEDHRKNIRKKLGITNRKTNLRAQLLSME